jgi:hypothetical protein
MSLPVLSKHQLTEIAGAAGIDHRTALTGYARFLAGDVPPIVRLALELSRRGVEVVSAPASDAK